MPSINRKICNKHGIYTGSYCKECKAERDKHYNKATRDAEATKFYNSTQWKKVRDEMMRRSGGVCAMCGGVSKRMIVDHIKEIKDGGCKLCYENLQVLCNSCHNKKTADESKKRSEDGK